MVRFGKTKSRKIRILLCNKKKKIINWDITADNIVISKLIEMKNNSKSLTGYSGDVI